ncbi:hypothetical protein [Mycoplasma sp. P36-A1]|uniref:hypothetical protein n=1 Tax=Mycoplasma sp. P36-A1 TaxID=3252900 RepID=UPI003C2FAC96
MKLKRNFAFLILITIFLITINSILSYTFHVALIDNVSVYDKVNIYITNISLMTNGGIMYIYNFPFIFSSISFVVLMAAILFFEKTDDTKYRYMKISVVLSFVILFFYNQYFMDQIGFYLNSHSMINNQVMFLLFNFITYNGESITVLGVSLISAILYIVILTAYQFDLKKDKKIRFLQNLK